MVRHAPRFNVPLLIGGLFLLGVGVIVSERGVRAVYPDDPPAREAPANLAALGDGSDVQASPEPEAVEPAPEIVERTIIIEREVPADPQQPPTEAAPVGEGEAVAAESIPEEPVADGALPIEPDPIASAAEPTTSAPAAAVPAAPTSTVVRPVPTVPKPSVTVVVVPVVPVVPTANPPPRPIIPPAPVVPAPSVPRPQPPPRPHIPVPTKPARPYIP